MSRQRSLHRHLRSLVVADLADHDDVRILAQQRAHAGGKSKLNVCLHLNLIKSRFHHFNGILDGGNIHFAGGQLLQRGIQGRRLARSGGAGDQDDAVGLINKALPDFKFLFGKSQLFEISP